MWRAQFRPSIPVAAALAQRPLPMAKQAKPRAHGSNPLGPQLRPTVREGQAQRPLPVAIQVDPAALSPARANLAVVSTLQREAKLR